MAAMDAEPDCTSSGEPDCTSSGEAETEGTNVTDVSVEVTTVDAMLDKLCQKYSRRRRRERKKGKKRHPLWNLQSLAILVIVVIFIIVVIMWSLLWIFIFRRESSSGTYFVGMFKVANVEFIPEYRHTGSSEFLSMANRIQYVVSSVYRKSSISRLYRHSVITDLSSIEGGVLVHFWMVFAIPRLKSTAVCEECVSAILRNSVLTSLQNRSSIGYLMGLPVDMDSILINAALRSDYTGTSEDSQCVEKMYASVLGGKVPLNVFSSWGGLSCHIKLTGAPAGSLIRLTITAFQIEASDCVDDGLTVYDALLPMKSRTLHKLCGPVSHAVSLVSTNNVMLLSFRLQQGSKSFRGHFQAIAKESCYSVIQLQSKTGGEISSPFYPSLLPPYCSCIWHFRSPDPSLGVALTFKNYALTRKDMRSCEHGWWKINKSIYCGSHIGHATVFYIPDPNPEVVFRCSSRRADRPITATYQPFNIKQPCPDGHFQCSTGLCVDKRRCCDGLDDCMDESDELFCAKPSKNCAGPAPLHPLFVCNGQRDCDNGKDETNCTLETSCSAIRFRCRSGGCILKRNAKCDGVFDCSDHSDESECACGLPSLGGRGQGRVVGGANALEGEWPWQVGLHYGGHLICGATVISAEWLLSAAHCFSRERLSDPRQWRAHLGMLTRGAAKYVAEIRRIVEHEYYNALNFDNDIALLQLKKTWPPSLNLYILPVCLPPPSQAVTEPHTCWVTGWGYRSEQDKVLPSTLQKAEVGVLSQGDCRRSFGQVSPRMLCAGVPSGESDACRGDSGGPLSCQMQRGSHWFLTGIVSWGAGCGRPNLPGVYTRVAKFIAWIRTHTLLSETLQNQSHD